MNSFNNLQFCLFYRFYCIDSVDILLKNCWALRNHQTTCARVQFGSCCGNFSLPCVIRHSRHYICWRCHVHACFWTEWGPCVLHGVSYRKSRCIGRSTGVIRRRLHYLWLSWTNWIIHTYSCDETTGRSYDSPWLSRRRSVPHGFSVFGRSCKVFFRGKQELLQEQFRVYLAPRFMLSSWYSDRF